MSDITIKFDNQGEFAAYHAATDFLRDRGFSVGSMQAAERIGILYGENIVIAKWRNMTGAQRAQLHGIIAGESKRHGPVTITIFASAPDAARKAATPSTKGK